MIICGFSLKKKKIYNNKKCQALSCKAPLFPRLTSFEQCVVCISVKKMRSERIHGAKTHVDERINGCGGRGEVGGEIKINK